MSPNKYQADALQRLAKSPDGEIIVSFYKDIISHYADVRQITSLTIEDIKARQLAANILEEEIIKRLQVLQNFNKKDGADNFE